MWKRVAELFQYSQPMICSTAQVAGAMFSATKCQRKHSETVASRQLPTPGHVGVLGNQRQRAHVSTPRPPHPQQIRRAPGRPAPPDHHPTGPGARGAASQPRASTSRIALRALGSLDRSAATAFVRFLPHLHFLLLVKRALHAPAIPFPSCPLPTSKSKRPRRRSTRTGRQAYGQDRRRSSFQIPGRITLQTEPTAQHRSSPPGSRLRRPVSRRWR